MSPLRKLNLLLAMLTLFAIASRGDRLLLQDQNQSANQQPQSQQSQDQKKKEKKKKQEQNKQQQPKPLFGGKLGLKSSEQSSNSATLGFNGVTPTGEVEA